MRRTFRVLSATFALCLTFALPVCAAWLADGTPVSVDYQDQTTPILAPDGNGGLVALWRDYRYGMGAWLFSQRLGSDGALLWPAQGEQVATTPYWKDDPQFVAGASNRLIVSYSDGKDEGAYHNIYVNCLEMQGSVDWGNYGVALCTASGHQWNPVSVTDGSGGAIVAWADLRNGSNSDIYARRVDANGTAQWTANGVALCTATGGQWVPHIVSDGAGGAIVAWTDYRSGTSKDICAGRISSSGSPLWSANGVTISSASGDQDSCAMVTDGAGGAIVVWKDKRGGTTSDLYAQRINASGTMQWTANGVAVCTATGDQGDPAVVADGSGGAVVIWPDRRGGVNWKLYAQRIGGDGVPKWSTNGVPICSAAGDQFEPAVAPDGIGGAMVAWTDSRGTSGLDICAQCVGNDGSLRWPAAGVALCTAANDQFGAAIQADGSGGAFVAWSDKRVTGIDCDLYAQHVSASGAPGCASDAATLSGDVQATVVSRPYVAVPQVVPQPGTTVRVQHDGVLVGSGGVTTNPGGAYSFTEAVNCGDQVSNLLENPTLFVISLTGLPSGGCTTSCQNQPLSLGAANHFTWGASDEVNALYLAERFQREYWQAALGVTLTKQYQIRVNDTSASTQRQGGGSTGTAAGSGNPVTSYAPGMPQYADAVNHEFVHRVIIERFGGPLSGGFDGTLEARGMDEGLADYFAAAYSGNSSFGSGIPSISTRALDQTPPVTYSICDGAYREDGYYGARIIGGALWDARKALVAAGAESYDVDRWVYDALENMKLLQPFDRTFRYLRAFLLTTPPFNTGANAQLVRDALDRHNISDNPLAVCTPRPQIKSVGRTVDSGGQHIALSWSGTPTAAWYRVYLRPFTSGSGLATGELVADHVTDSSYVYSQADTLTVVALLVSAVDAAGNESPVSGEGPQVTSVHGPSATRSKTMRVWPNPAMGEALISFGARLTGPAELRIYDLLGRRVRRLEIAPGADHAAWDEEDDRGRRVAAGVYLIRDQSAGEVRTVHVVVVR